MQELVTSIEELGLMHPPVLRYEETGLVLVAGERRLRAIQQIYELGSGFTHDGELVPEGMVPYTNLGDLTELEAEEAELDENLKRKDLTWQEHAAAVEKLHNLRIRQQEHVFQEAIDAGKVTGDASQVAEQFPQHTVADTAQELTGRRDGFYHDTVRQELIVARHLDNPLVAGAKDAKEAFKILKKEEERRKNVALAVEVGKTFDVEKHSLFQVNCLHWMWDYAHGADLSSFFDVICTDPPYGMGAQDFGDGAGKMTAITHQYDDSYESWQTLMKAWAPLSFAITKPQAHAYVFCDFDNFHELKGYMQAAGWYVFRTPIINHKLNSGRVPLPDQGPRRQYELVLYAIKGKMPVTHIYPDVLSCTADDNTGHGAQKPVAVYQNLLQRSVRPGMRVLDSFCGSGPIFEAAHGFKCYAVGLEQSQEYYGKSLKRLQTLKAFESNEIPGL